MDSDEMARQILAEDTGEQAPPVHESPPVSPQPMQEIVNQLDRALTDIGGLVSRTDQLEATIRRVDRQVLMMAGTLVIVLWSVKQFAGKLEGLKDAGV